MLNKSSSKSSLNPHSPIFIPSYLSPANSPTLTQQLPPSAAPVTWQLVELPTAVDNHDPDNKQYEEFEDDKEDDEPYDFYPVSNDLQTSPFMNGLSCSPDASPVFTDLNSKLQTICTQVEFLFSDNNLRKDKYLQGELAKNEDGFVSIDAIAAHKKVASLTHDKSLLICALRQSKKLHLDSLAMKVRRINAYKMTSKVKQQWTQLFVTNLSQNMTEQSLTQLFSKFGKVKSVGLEVGKIAVIEYNKHNAAKRALAAAKLHQPSLLGLKLTYKAGSKQNTASNAKEKESEPVTRPAPRDEMNWRLEANPNSSHITPSASSSSSSNSSNHFTKQKNKKQSSPKTSEHKTIEATKEPLPLVKPSNLTNLQKRATVVNRTAKGPDGTRGFGAGRGRPIPA